VSICPTDKPTPGTIPCLLIGLGRWGRDRYFPVLVQLARWGVIDLTLVEQYPISKAPSEVLDLESVGLLRFRNWAAPIEADVAALWQVAFVVTDASSHRLVIRRLLEEAPNLRTIVCEKPCGDSLEQFLDIDADCKRHGVVLVVADHFLLRPAVRFLIANVEWLRSIGTPSSIVASITESGGNGPSQGVIADLAVHLVNILFLLFPGASFTLSHAYLARVVDGTHGRSEDYTLAIGVLNLEGGSTIPCELEVGKRVGDDKSVTIVAPKGRLKLDLIGHRLTLLATGRELQEVILQWEGNWNYGPLILSSIFNYWAASPQA
jgi:predicted dehydrogenase